MEHENFTPLQWGSMIDGMRRFLASVHELVPAGQLSPQQVTKLIDDLPHLTEPRLIALGEKDSSCPICMTPYLTILTEEETAHAMDSPAHPVEELGVTTLDRPWQCGHIFCRRDISKWIIEGHDSCPMCRKCLVEPAQDADAATTTTTQPESDSTSETQSPPPQPTTTTTDPTTNPNPNALESLFGARLQGVNGAHPALGPEDLDWLAQMQRELEEQLRGHGHGHGHGHGLGRGRREEEDDDDRHEFAGMYS